MEFRFDRWFRLGEDLQAVLTRAQTDEALQNTAKLLVPDVLEQVRKYFATYQDQRARDAVMLALFTAMTEAASLSMGMGKQRICQCNDCQRLFTGDVLKDGGCPDCGSKNWRWAHNTSANNLLNQWFHQVEAPAVSDKLLGEWLYLIMGLPVWVVTCSFAGKVAIDCDESEYHAVLPILEIDSMVASLVDQLNMITRGRAVAFDIDGHEIPVDEGIWLISVLKSAQATWFTYWADEDGEDKTGNAKKK